jgi:tripartite-type tricarboxylate transporter receptor subunit TctC
MMRALFALALTFAAAAAAQPAYPVKPVRVIVAQAAGSASDQLIRPVAHKLTEALGQQFVIDNRPGAGGNIGAEAAAKAPPDGYTLLMISAPHTVAPALYRKLNYDLMRDLTPVAMLGFEPLCLVVHPSLPATDLRELVALLKQRPGQVSYASTGNGAVNHLAMELLKSRAGVDVVHVPYKGTPLALPDVLSGAVPLLFANISPLIAHIRSARLRPIAVSSGRRVNLMPQVPTIAESGYAGYEAVNWFALVAPAQTPDEVVRKLNATVRQVVAAPEVRDLYESRATQSAASSPQEMHGFLNRELTKWAAVVKASGARID